jgi:hypothetical protein
MPSTIVAFERSTFVVFVRPSLPLREKLPL